jgi:cyclase
LVRAVTAEVSVPVIASGGMGRPEDLVEVVQQGQADAVAMADILHYQRASVKDIRQIAQTVGIPVRRYESG